MPERIIGETLERRIARLDDGSFPIAWAMTTAKQEIRGIGRLQGVWFIQDGLLAGRPADACGLSIKAARVRSGRSSKWRISGNSAQPLHFWRDSGWCDA
jgi:hypothetical protein